MCLIREWWLISLVKGCERGDDRAGFTLVNCEGVCDTFAQVDGVAARVPDYEDAAAGNAPECSFVVSVPFCRGNRFSPVRRRWR